MCNLSGTDNQVQNGAELTIMSGGTFTAATGSVVDLFNATVALPNSVTLTNARFSGFDNRLLDGASLTLFNGSTIIAAAGSTVDLSASNASFPTTVVLTTGDQTLFGKTLVSPVISSISSAATTDLTLSGGSSGAALTLGQGTDGIGTTTRHFKAPGFIGTATGKTAQLSQTVPAVQDVERYLFLSHSANPAKAPFGLVFGTSGFSDHLDDVMYFGYNVANGGGRYLQSEPRFSFQIEQDYLQGGVEHTLESYFEWQSVDGLQQRRPIFWQINRSSGAMNNFVFRSAGIEFTDWDNDTEPIFASLYKTGFVLRGLEGQTNNTSLGINAKNGRDAELFFNGASAKITGASAGLTIIAGNTGNASLTFMTNSEANVVTPALVLDGASRRATFGAGVTLAGTLTGVTSLAISGDFSGATTGRFASTEESNSPSTGAVVIGNGTAGGLGVGGSIFTGGGVSIPYSSDGTPALRFNGDSTAGFGSLDGSSLRFTLGGTRCFLMSNDSTLFGEGNASSIRLASTGAITLTTSNGRAVSIPDTTASTSTTTGSLIVAGGFGLAGNQFLGGSLNLSGGGALSGSSGSLALTAGGSSQNITLTPSGSGVVTTPAAFRAGGALSTSATTASTSPTTGALVVAGGFGLGGDLFMGGSLNFSGAGLIASGGSLALTAGGTNQNITLSPSGTGILSIAAPFSAAGAITTSATTASTSTATGALVVAGGFGLAGNQFLGGSLNLAGGGVLSGAAGSLSLTAGGTNQNIALTASGNGAVTVAGPLSVTGNQLLSGTLSLSGGGTLSGASGALSLSAAGTNQNVTLAPSGSGTVALAGPVNATGAFSVSASTPSTSTATGALVVAGGFGLAGNQFLGGSLNLAGGGVLTGTAGSLALIAGGTNQNITLTPSGTGTLLAAGPFTATGAISTTATTASTSTLTGALVVAGGFGLAGNQYLGGSLNLAGGGVLAGSAGSLSLTAGGTDKDITLTPSGTGRVVFAGPVTFSGNQTFAGALTLSGGGALAGTAGSVDVTAGGTNRNITLTPSGTGGVAVTGPLSVTGNQTLAGALSLSGGGTLGGSSGALTLAAAGTNQNVTLAPSGTGTVALTGPVTATGTLAVSATAPSTSTSTGALIVAGGFGLAGDQYLGGALNLSDGGTLSGSAGALSLAAGGTNKDITLTPSGTGRIVFAGPVTFPGNQTFTGTIALSGGGTVAGSSGSIALTAGGTNQSITLTPSGSGQLSTSAPFSAGGPIITGATTASTSTSTGALVVAGGFGLAGNQFLGGSLNLSGGGNLAGSAGALALTAGGTNQNITLTPSGSGGLVVAGPVSASGPLTLSSTTNSTSTSTGALVVSGGAAFQKATSFGDDLLLTPTASTAATVRLSGTAIADVPGLWFRDGGTPTSTNVTLSSSAFSTILNGPSSGSLSLRVGNTNYLTLNATSATLQTIPLRVISASASTSTTTGSATFAGGIGVSGRTSTGSLSVGAGPSVSAILSVTASLDFPAIVANGGVQDLTVAVAGATIGNDVRIVEAGGSFAEAGLILRGIVSATGSVTVRATNATTAAINPAPMSYRVTVTKF